MVLEVAMSAMNFPVIDCCQLDETHYNCVLAIGGRCMYAKYLCVSGRKVRLIKIVHSIFITGAGRSPGFTAHDIQ